MDIIASSLELAKRIAIYHIVPALILSSTTLLLVLGIIKLCRIKRPSLRGTLYFIALLKPLFVLIQGTYALPHEIDTPISPALQLPDPMNFIPAHLWHTDLQLINTNMRIILILALTVVSIFLFWHWRSYYLFCRELSKQPSFKQSGKQAFWNILTKLRKRIGVRARLLITRTEYDSPFSVGMRNPIMVFPSYILAHLTLKEKEAVLSHELMHIRQRDTIRQWIPVILRDLLLFSPFVHFTFVKIGMEREKRIDEAAVNYLNDFTSLSSALLKTKKLMTEKKNSVPMTQSFLTQKFLKPKRALTERIEALMALPEKRDDHLPWTKRILIGMGIALLLYPQIFLHIRAFPYVIQIF